MTSFEVISNALNSIKDQGADKFKEDMRKVGEVLQGIKDSCTEEQKETLSELLEDAGTCTDGLSEEVDTSGFLGLLDDELFAMFFFTKILEQVA